MENLKCHDKRVRSLRSLKYAIQCIRHVRPAHYAHNIHHMHTYPAHIIYTQHTFLSPQISASISPLLHKLQKLFVCDQILGSFKFWNTITK